MPELGVLLLFATAALALTASPGPDMLLIASRSASQGRGAGFATLAGIQVGTYCHALAAAFGLSQLFLLVPVAYDVVRYAGAAYLLWLAWTTVRSAGVAPSQAPPTRYPLGDMFWQGLATNLLNPKMALFVLALFPQFVDPQVGSVALQILLLATVLNAIGLVVNGVVILMANQFGRLFTGGGRWRRLPHYLLGAVFAGLAVRLAFDTRR
jgi:threonine/homoserine/homoserine lactone efflux protein